MRKAVIITCVSLAGLIILDQSGVLNSLLMFLLVGAIPGTGYSIPSTIMLLFIASAAWLVVIRLISNETFYSVSSKKSKRSQASHKKRMPKRRFSEV